MATPKGFVACTKLLHKNRADLLQYLETNEKPKRRMFVTKTTKALYETCLQDRQKEIKGEH